MKMAEENNIKYWAILLIVGTVALGGCLSDDESSGIDSTPIPPDANRAPIISGNPTGSVRIGDAYSFTPTASDPDGDQIGFSVDNQPSWASFDALTGTLSGSPTLGDVGTFTNVTISVSDGEFTSSLGAYSITVTQVALGSTTLSWIAPTQNDDGSDLADLRGFNIYYGTQQGNYQSSIRIDNAGLTTYMVENLTPDTYYFVSTAFNSNDVESAFSNEVVKVVN
jgi:hypothetical protein